MRFSLEETTLNGVLNYLGTRPYLEVFNLIREVQTAQPVATVQEPLSLVKEATNDTAAPTSTE